MYPRDTCIPGIHVSLGFMYPRNTCIPGMHVSQGFMVSLGYMYSRDTCIHGIHVSLGYMYPKDTCMGVHVSQGYMYPWDTCIPGVHVSQGYMISPLRVRIEARLVDGPCFKRIMAVLAREAIGPRVCKGLCGGGAAAPQTNLKTLHPSDNTSRGASQGHVSKACMHPRDACISRMRVSQWCLHPRHKCISRIHSSQA